ncbi:MAG: PilW family protein [Steroidobacteraceae bacterium]
MNRMRGFSMVELMVAITLALVVTTGVISIFVGSRSAFQSTSGTAALTDGGRFALNFISNSVRSAGYMSCTTASHVQAILNPGATPLPYSFNQALGGFEANNTGVGAAYNIVAPPVAADPSAADWVGGLDAALTPGLGALAPIVNNDVLVVRSTLGNAQSVYVSSIPNGAPQFTVNTQGPLQANQIAVISDCYKAIAFQISSVTPGANAVVAHNAGGGPPGNSTSTFGPLSFTAGAEVTPVDTVVYYIGTGADGDGALFAWDMNAVPASPPTELVPDIEAMQILYGLDSFGTQSVSEYVTADLVADFNTVMSVKVALLAASAPGSAKTRVANVYNLLGTQVTAPVDTRARQVFEETIAVRNALP